MKKERKYSILTKLYKDVLDDIMITIAASNMSVFSKKQVEEELLNIFVQACSDKKSVERVIGASTEQFVNDVIQAHGARNNFFTYELSGVQYFIMYLFLVQGIEYIKNLETNIEFFNTGIENSTILLFGILAFITIPLTRFVYQVGARKSRFSIILSAYIFVPVFTVGGFIAIMEFGVIEKLFGEMAWTEALMEKSSIVISNGYILVGIASCVGIAWWLKRVIQKRAINQALYN